MLRTIRAGAAEVGVKGDDGVRVVGQRPLHPEGDGPAESRPRALHDVELKVELLGPGGGDVGGLIG